MEQAVNREHGTRNARRAAAGFTVLELLIAATIALLIFVIGLTLLNGASQARVEAQKRLGASDSARMVFEALERDIAGAYSGYARSALVQEFKEKDPTKPADPEHDPVVQFLSMTTTTEQRGDTPAEYLSVRYHASAFSHVLYREVTANGAFTETTPTPSTTYAVCSDVEKMILSFARWDETAKAYTDRNPTPPYLPLDSAHATHLLVQLQFLDPNEKVMEQDPLTKNLVRVRRSYQKLIPIPDGVK